MPTMAESRGHGLSKTPDRNEIAAVNADAALFLLHEQVEEARAELSRLLQDVAEAENRRGGSHGAELLEANEQLVFAMLRAQAEAQTAAQALQEVARSAEHDEMTGLPNRVLLLDRLAHAIANARRHNARLALLFLDLNNFKQINDTLGHAVGDQVLKLVAHSLASSVRGSDTVSRHGGDEFLILLAEVAHASDAVLIADKVLAALSAPSRVGDHVLRLTASIGISIYPDDGEDAATLIDRADAAMYRAKRHGLGSSVFHDEKPASERSLEPPPLKSLQQPLTHYELALAEHDRRYAQLREANEQLVLAALSAQELQAAAEQAQRRQTEFLAVVAHELRDPLTPIRTAAALLSDVRTQEPLLLQVQAVMERQVLHMSRLVNDLLDVSRVNTGKLSLERRVVEMAGIVDEAVDACRPAMDTRLQHFVVQVPARALEVDGDPIRLVQILCNLLDNASKYTQVGGEIRLSVVATGAAIVLTVADKGIGITAEALPNVFEPFTQDAHATVFNRDGLGIGLTVVRELVEAHGGTVVASSPGSGLGSQFVVTLPMRPPSAESESSGHAAATLT
jgi:diguanylate cyclase (GGDEF)-like protein